MREKLLDMMPAEQQNTAARVKGALERRSALPLGFAFRDLVSRNCGEVRRVERHESRPDDPIHLRCADPLLYSRPFDRNHAARADEIEIERHAPREKTRRAHAALAFLETDNANLFELLEGARQVRLLATGERRQLAQRTRGAALHQVK